MLNELVKYYDCVTSQPDNDFVPDGYSKVTNVAYKIVLTRDGKLKDILENKHDVKDGKRIKTVGYDELFPFRENKPAIAAETIDCREKYLFGLKWDKQNSRYDSSDKNDQKAFEKAKQKNLEFLSDLSSDVIDAYKAFLNTWNPEKETENPILVSIGNNFNTAKFIIVVEDSESKSRALHVDPAVTEKWDKLWQKRSENTEDTVMGQCSISGEYAPISRLHNNLKGIIGGNATGVNLVSFNMTSSWSYGKENSYNSSVSAVVMEKYTSAFNYLASSKAHSRRIDDMTLLFWANTRNRERPYLDDFTLGLWEDADVALEEEAQSISQGVNEKRTADIDENVEFCVLGIKPNASRLAIKIFEKDRFGNIMERIEKHQEDMRLSVNDRPIMIWQIEKCLKSPKSTNDVVPPDLAATLLTAILKNRPYPDHLLHTLVRRVKIDDEKEVKSINRLRARIIKACLVRSGYYKGDEYMIKSKDQTDAFRCGRLFAVLEKIQESALGDLNATIKDKFFASACATPDLVFTRLIKLAQAHLAKLDVTKSQRYDSQLQMILSGIEAFPTALSLKKQGDFILGYYQQKNILRLEDKEGDNNETA